MQGRLFINQPIRKKSPPLSPLLYKDPILFHRELLRKKGLISFWYFINFILEVYCRAGLFFVSRVNIFADFKTMLLDPSFEFV